MTYNVIIDPVDPINNESALIERVLVYRYEGDGVFYVSGIDFEQWFILRPGQTVQVTESDDEREEDNA